jgi:flagellar biosynthetic protein FliR
MIFSEALLLSIIANYSLPFVRISACIMSMMAFGSGSVPSVVKLGLAIAVTIVMVPSIPPLSQDIYLLSPTYFVLVGYQILIGIMLGFITQFISQIFVIAGQVIAMQTGLGFASLVDPVSGSNTPVVGQFFTVLTMLMFFQVDGHIAVFYLIHMSFTALPIGMNGLFDIPFVEIAKFGSVMFYIALSLSISSICAMLLVNFTFGVLTRAAPQLNIFSMGFAVSLVCGIIVLKLVMSGFSSHFINSMNKVFDLGCRVVGESCPNVFY